MYRYNPAKKSPKDYKHTFTYIIEEAGGAYIKVGRTSQKNISKRLDSIQTGNPRKLTLILILQGDYEEILHKRFASSRASSGGCEWFLYTPDIKEWIKENSHLDVEEIGLGER